MQGLTTVKESHAATIIRVAKARGLPKRAAVIAIETALVESELQNFANYNLPASLNYPHDAVGSDHASVGVMQQQPWWWDNDLAKGMDPAYQAGAFFDALVRFDYLSMPTGQAAQRVQVSAFPDRYQTREAFAEQIVGWLWGLGGSVGLQEEDTMLDPDDPVIRGLREKIQTVAEKVQSVAEHIQANIDAGQAAQAKANTATAASLKVILAKLNELEALQ